STFPARESLPIQPKDFFRAVNAALDDDPTRIGQTGIPAGNPDDLKQVKILLLCRWKAICAWALHLTQNREEPLGRLEHSYAYLRINEEARLQAIPDHACCLLHALPR